MISRRGSQLRNIMKAHGRTCVTLICINSRQRTFRMTNNRDMNKSSELTSTHSADLNMVARVDNEPVEPNQAEQALIEDEAEEVDDQVIEQEEAEADAMQENDDGESVNPPTEVQG